MNETDRQAAIARYLDEVAEQFYSGHAKEHAYRPALKELMSTFDDTIAVNDPKHSEHGAPDFIFRKRSNEIIKGYAEAKDIGVSLDKTEKTDQMTRYGGYANLFLTDYLEFRFFRNGEKYQTISLGYIKDGKLHKTPENAMQLMRELEAFLTLPPERIRSGKRLAQIMGGKSRRIRDNVKIYLTQDDAHDIELNKIYEMMKKMLVHDLSEDKFADMYAQTLVYGLFVARYGDKTPDSFSREEARDLVPKSNPFLRHFFDHIVGPDFDARLGYIVDELCEIFLVSNVSEIVHKHLRIADETTDAKDPIIHFYEDFLQEYDPAERKKMGAYYTPIPVVRFIVTQVDQILRDEFGISQGLASDETIEYEIETGQDLRADRRTKQTTKQKLILPRVQILDPAVGTATFLNETIKHIHKSFIGQEGRWASYVNDSLLKRLYGFEIMMAPYTIAHLKLGMTLQETGVEKLNERLSVFLTNTLEEGIPQQSSLFDFGLAGAVSEESRLAAEIKSERPVMLVMGNPPYSISSNNKSKFIEKLVGDYKKDLNERNIQPLSDDYIKFIRFAEEMVAKNGSGVVAMITNNSYIDGIIHRQMRGHLAKTFDKIYVLDLHGNSKKQEATPDGSKDENVFDIQQGVSIILAIKSKQKNDELATIYHSDLWGSRKKKFNVLLTNNTTFKQVSTSAPHYYFTERNSPLEQEYNKGIAINQLFNIQTSGVVGGRDGLNVQFDADFNKKISDFKLLDEKEIADKYNLEDSRDWTVKSAVKDIRSHESTVYKIAYKPLDTRYSIYTGVSKGFVQYPRQSFWPSFQQDNIGLNLMRKIIPGNEFSHVFISKDILDKNYYGFQTYTFPLWIYHGAERTENLNSTEVSALTRHLHVKPSSETLLDYVYAILHWPAYRQKYLEFLKSDFPRIPVPENQQTFDRFSEFGAKLRELHLMTSPALDSRDTTYPEPGTNVVDLLKYDNGQVWINNTQYFGNVPQVAWDFHIGGYLPAQKWLKDRKGRKLSNHDLAHYQKVIKILIETNRIMREIG